MNKLQELIKKPIEEERNNISKLDTKINNAHNKIFPDLKIGVDLDIADIVIDPLKQLERKSQISFFRSGITVLSGINKERVLRRLYSRLYYKFVLN